MVNPPSTNPVTDKLAKAGADDDATIEQFREVDTTRPLTLRERLQADPRLHGHLTDGARGHETAHDHDEPPGHVAHGHKRGRGLDWTAAISDYVRPLAAAAPNVAASEVDPAPASIPGAMGAPETDTPPTTVGVGSGAAGPGRPTALAVADHAALDGFGGRLQATIDKVRRRLAELETVAEVAQLADTAGKQLDYDDLVSAAVVRRLKATVDRWAAGRGVA